MNSPSKDQKIRLAVYNGCIWEIDIFKHGAKLKSFVHKIMLQKYTSQWIDLTYVFVLQYIWGCVRYSQTSQQEVNKKAKITWWLFTSCWEICHTISQYFNYVKLVRSMPVMMCREIQTIPCNSPLVAHLKGHSFSFLLNYMRSWINLGEKWYGFLKLNLEGNVIPFGPLNPGGPMLPRSPITPGYPAGPSGPRSPCDPICLFILSCTSCSSTHWSLCFKSIWNI